MKYTGRNGWVASRKDAWSLDGALNPIIAAGLRQFIKDGLDWGIPGVMCEDGEDHEVSKARWKTTLEQMVYAFEDKEPDIGDYDFTIVFDSADAKGLTLGSMEANIAYSTRVINKPEQDKYHADATAHDARVQEGLNLFAKYYKNLWW